MMGSSKIVLIGAGSAIFGLTTLATILKSDRLRGSEIWLVDINKHRRGRLVQGY